MEIDYEFWKFVVTVSNFIGIVALAVYNFVTSRSRVNTARIDRLEEHTDGRIDRLEKQVQTLASDHDKRLERVEERNRHMPTHEDLKNVHEKINRVSNDFGEVKGQLIGIASNVKLIQEYLMSEGKK